MEKPPKTGLKSVNNQAELGYNETIFWRPSISPDFSDQPTNFL